MLVFSVVLILLVNVQVRLQVHEISWVVCRTKFVTGNCAATLIEGSLQSLIYITITFQWLLKTTPSALQHGGLFTSEWSMSAENVECLTVFEV